MSKIDLYTLTAIAGVIIFGIGAIGMVCNRTKTYESEKRKSTIKLVDDGETGQQVEANGFNSSNSETGSNAFKGNFGSPIIKFTDKNKSFCFLCGKDIQT